MLNIIERFVQNNGWSYGRLDGSTPVGARQARTNEVWFECRTSSVKVRAVAQVHDDPGDSPDPCAEYNYMFCFCC